MLALYRSGRQAESLEVYRDARRALVDELGIEPGRELQALEGAILRQTTSPSRPAQPPIQSRHAAPEEPVGRSRVRAGSGDQRARRRLRRPGRLILLAGEPGIGKSRLAEELVSQARGRGARVLVGRCWEAGGAPAYWPWVQSLRGYIGEP